MNLKDQTTNKDVAVVYYLNEGVLLDHLFYILLFLLDHHL
jgi:hypothetical protein